MIHELKLDTQWFDAVVNGQKRLEIRRNDRDYQVGDTLILKEVERCPGGGLDYTGNEITAKVSYVLKAEDFPDGLQKGYVILSINVAWWLD